MFFSDYKLSIFVFCRVMTSLDLIWKFFCSGSVRAKFPTGQKLDASGGPTCQNWG